VPHANGWYRTGSECMCSGRLVYLQAALQHNLGLGGAVVVTIYKKAAMAPTVGVSWRLIKQQLVHQDVSSFSTALLRFGQSSSAPKAEVLGKAPASAPAAPAAAAPKAAAAPAKAEKAPAAAASTGYRWIALRLWLTQSPSTHLWMFTVA